MYWVYIKKIDKLLLDMLIIFRIIIMKLIKLNFIIIFLVNNVVYVLQIINIRLC
jgi:hypothetical protein